VSTFTDHSFGASGKEVRPRKNDSDKGEELALALASLERLWDVMGKSARVL
jgi:hypothetical protein